MNRTYAYLRNYRKIKFRMVSVQHFINEAPGLSLNLDKCELLPIRSCSAPFLFNIPVKSQVNYFGVIICKDDNARGKLIYSALRKYSYPFFHILLYCCLMLNCFKKKKFPPHQSTLHTP